VDLVHSGGNQGEEEVCQSSHDDVALDSLAGYWDEISWIHLLLRQELGEMAVDNHNR